MNEFYAIIIVLQFYMKPADEPPGLPEITAHPLARPDGRTSRELPRPVMRGARMAGVGLFRVLRQVGGVVGEQGKLDAVVARPGHRRVVAARGW